MVDPNITARKIIVRLIVTFIDIFFFSGATYFLWNYLSPTLGLVTITPIQAVAIFLLSRFLLKDHLLSSEPTVVHCDCEDDDVDEKETRKTAEV